MLAISTAWNYYPGCDVRHMLMSIKEAGVNAVELGYKVTANDLPEILAALKEFAMTATSVHNFCPVPNDYPSPRHPSNYYRLSSLEESERKLAVQWTKEAVRTAKAAGATVVVIHAGTVEMPEELAEGLFKKFKISDLGAGQFEDLRDRFIQERSRARGPYMDSVVKSLAEITDFAESQNIKIGLESRYYPTEIPNHIEIGELLTLFHAKGLWYWHDVGHAEVNERLGIYHHVDCLKTYESYLIGFHLHGMKIMRDHLAPFDSDLDLQKIFPFIQRDHIKVIESHSSTTAIQMKEAVARLKCLEVIA